MEFESLKGFREFYPNEMAARRDVFDSIADSARSFGFREIDTPSLEPISLYEVKSGEEIVEETYSFEDRGGRRVTLTPEITPSVVRMFAAKQQAISKPAKWFSFPKLWRYEQPQSGRLREFYQPNFDIFGVKDQKADAELISLAHKILIDLGLSDEFVFKISHRDLIEGVFNALDLENQQMETAYRAVDKADRLEEPEIREELRNADIEADSIDAIVDISDISGDIESFREIQGYESNESIQNSIDELEALRDELMNNGVLAACEFDASIVRGLDYYTGAVFECFDKQGRHRAIFGGGRYDDLVEEFGGQPTPATGFGMGDATLELLLKQAGCWPDEEIHTDYYLAVLGDTRETASEISSTLRGSGYKVEVNIDGGGLSSQLDRADAVNADKTIIVGERDLAKGVVTLKDMDTGDQHEVDIEEYT